MPKSRLATTRFLCQDPRSGGQDVRATRPIIYTRIGALYVLTSLPSWVLLAMGRLFEDRNPHLLIALGGLPLGAFFLLFGRGVLPVNSRSGIGARVASIGLFFAAVALASLLAVRAGAELLATAVLFSAMAASYLSLIAFGFLAAAALRRGAGPEES